MGRVQDKVALITGGALGIGRRSAERLAEEGAVVVLADVLEEEGAQAASEIGGRASFINLDVTQESAWVRAMEWIEANFGRLDVLMNNAGISPAGDVESTTYDLWQQVMNVNAGGVFLGCKYGVGLMKRHGGGSIINMSSMVAIRSSANLAAYSASKAAVRLLTKSVALYGGPLGIRCNSVHPGGVQTRMLDAFRKLFPDEESANQALARQNPLGRPGETIDIANAVLYLASDESSWTTGMEMCVDGGALL